MHESQLIQIAHTSAIVIKTIKVFQFFQIKILKAHITFFTVPSIDNLMTGIEKVQNEALIPKEKQVFARSVEESNWFDSGLSFYCQ